MREFIPLRVARSLVFLSRFFFFARRTHAYVHTLRLTKSVRTLASRHAINIDDAVLREQRFLEFIEDSSVHSRDDRKIGISYKMYVNTCMYTFILI